MEKNKKFDFDPTCEPCEENFQNEINKLVDNVEGYTKKDHNRKKEELNETFEND